MLTVTQYQRNLKHYYAYYTGAIDGIKGTGTRNAIIRFQRDHGLAVDGIYGTNTNAKLVSCIASLQAKLGVTQDGIVGTNTINAIRAFQSRNGLVVDGIAGTATFKALNNNIGDGSSTHFKKAEFACECGGKYCNGYPGGTTSAKLLNILEAVRSNYGGKPVYITSGQRCDTFNRQIGGISNSAHKYGKAADIYIPGVTDTVAGRNAVIAYAYKCGAAYSYGNTPGMGNAVHINV